ncbi:MAG: hypothetical protein QXF76_00210 [Candidatus Anstonellales archaeon]
MINAITVEELLIKKKDESYPETNFKLKIIGLGGCGTNIVNRLTSLGVDNNVIAINTDALQLRSINHKVKKFLIGKNITKGFGCGGNAELGKRVMEESLESLIKLLPETNLTVITLGLSGGTGHGGIVPLVNKLKELGNDVIVIATLPFKIERAKREVAKQKAIEISQIADALILLDNQSLVDIASSLPLSNSFYAMDEKIADLLLMFNNIFNKPSLINVDYADMHSLLIKGKGFATYSFASINKQEEIYKIEEKINQNSLLLGNKDSAKAALLYLRANYQIPLGDAIKVLETASSSLNQNSEVSFGIDLSEGNENHYIKIFSVYFGIEIDLHRL